MIHRAVTKLITRCGSVREIEGRPYTAPEIRVPLPPDLTTWAVDEIPLSVAPEFETRVFQFYRSEIIETEVPRGTLTVFIYRERGA